MPPFDPTFRVESDEPAGGASHDGTDRRLRAQIVDLREMAEEGTLEDEHRYFGVDAPSGARWYNFDPLTFLECGARGAFGGWEEGDDTGVQYVPGQVAVLGPDGIETVEPRDVPDPVRDMPEVTWEDVTAFLECGQGGSQHRAHADRKGEASRAHRGSMILDRVCTRQLERGGGKLTQIVATFIVSLPWRDPNAGRFCP